MTKSVRIENADTSDHEVTVFIEDLDPDTGEWVRQAHRTELYFPTALATHAIWKGRRLVVEEVDAP